MYKGVCVCVAVCVCVPLWVRVILFVPLMANHAAFPNGSTGSRYGHALRTQSMEKTHPCQSVKVCVCVPFSVSVFVCWTELVLVTVCACARQ